MWKCRPPSNGPRALEYWSPAEHDTESHMRQSEVSYEDEDRRTHHYSSTACLITGIADQAGTSKHIYY